MTRRAVWLPALVVMVLVAAICSAPAGDDTEPTPVIGDPSRGERLYTTGQSDRGGMPAARVFGMSLVPASRYPCALCHGSAGRGGREAGTEVADIRHQQLSVPLLPGGTRDRQRPAYTPGTLARAIREGRDPAGQALDIVMPRYAMDAQDLADLIAYLQILGPTSAPGTDAGHVRVGMLLPTTGPWAAQARAVDTIVHRYIEHLNQAGGIHGRRIEVVTADPGNTEADAVAAAARLVTSGEAGENHRVFCFLAGLGAGAGRAVREFLDARGVPLIGPLVFMNDDEDLRLIHHILPSLADQARAGALYLARRQSATKPPIALMAAGRGPAASMARAFLQAASQAGLDVHRMPIPRDRAAAGASLQELHQAGISTLVVFAASDTLDQLMATAATRSNPPRVMAAAILLSRPPNHPPDMMLMPPLAPGLSTPGPDAPDVLLDDLAAAPGGRIMEMAAFAAAQLFSAALRATGRDLHREDFVTALHTLRDLPSGVMPPLGFDRIHRHAVRGALITDRADDDHITAVWVAVPSG